MQLIFRSESGGDTSGFAQAFARVLVPADVILLKGPVGAGKSHFVRAALQKMMTENGTLEDVVSPTFTITQIYNVGAIDIWHADLYRLGHVDELIEIGLEEAFDDGIVFIEWAEKLGQLKPKSALDIEIKILSEDARELVLEWTDSKWNTRLNDIAKAQGLDV